MDFSTSPIRFGPQKLFKLLAFVLFLGFTVTVEAAPRIPVTDPRAFAGMKKQDYPGLFLVRRTPHLNIFWSSRTSCGNGSDFDKVPSQADILDVQRVLQTDLEARIDWFEKFAASMIPEWEARVSKKVFPVNIVINIGDSMMCGSVQKGSLYVYNGKGQPEIELLNETFVASGGDVKNSDERYGMVGIQMHEIGHIMAAALGYTDLVTMEMRTLDDVFADFVSLMSAPNDPLVGFGYGDFVEQADCRKNLKALGAMEREKTKANCRIHSVQALRDLSLPLQYPDMYQFFEEHNLAAHVNSLFFQLNKIVGPELLFKSVMREVMSLSPATLDSEMYLFVKAVTERILLEAPENAMRINELLTSREWKPATASTLKLIVRRVTNEQGLSFAFKPSASQQKAVLGLTAFHINVKASGQTRYMLQYFKSVGEPVLNLVRVPACKNAGCYCFKPGETLSVDAMFLGRPATPMRTPEQLLLTLKRRTCYSFTNTTPFDFF